MVQEFYIPFESNLTSLKNEGKHKGVQSKAHFYGSAYRRIWRWLSPFSTYHASAKFLSELCK